VPGLSSVLLLAWSCLVEGDGGLGPVIALD